MRDDFTRRDLLPVFGIPYEDPRTVVPDRDRARENSHRPHRPPDSYPAYATPAAPPIASGPISRYTLPPVGEWRTRPAMPRHHDRDHRPATTPGRGDEARRSKRANPAVGVEAGGGVRRQVGHAVAVFDDLDIQAIGGINATIGLSFIETVVSESWLESSSQHASTDPYTTPNRFLPPNLYYPPPRYSALHLRVPCDRWAVQAS